MLNHQHTLIIDGTSGISGDMTVAALLDLGASKEHLREQLARCRSTALRLPFHA